MLVLLGLFVLAIWAPIFICCECSASDFRRWSSILAMQGILLLVPPFLTHEASLSMSRYALFCAISLFPLPTTGFIWALDRMSFAGRLPHIVRAVALSFFGAFLTVIGFIGWVFAWLFSMQILQWIGILPNEGD
jgi:hypothetical protein